MSTGKSPEEVGVSPGGRGPLALIAGPTASGKSDLAVRLALAHGKAVVINADSAQVYADLRILSARPGEDEMQGVPHRLFGTWDGATACSAADWASAARTEIAAAHAKGLLPILVGGTGLYIRTLLDGIAPVPPIDPAIREEVRALPVAAAHAALLREDPERAAALAPADTTRIARALEVVRSTGRPLSDWHARREGGIANSVELAPLVIEADRSWLSGRCDRRFEIMARNGARDEVAALLARGLDPALPVMRAIGVREVAAWLDGALDRDAAIAAGQLATRQYAKRQATWFRHQLPQAWKRVSAENIISGTPIETLFVNIALT